MWGYHRKSPVGIRKKPIYVFVSVVPGHLGQTHESDGSCKRLFKDIQHRRGHHELFLVHQRDQVRLRHDAAGVPVGPSGTCVENG
jgi:hypothetical protein